MSIADPAVAVISEAKPQPRHGPGAMGSQKLLDVLRLPGLGASTGCVDVLHCEDRTILGITALGSPTIRSAKRLEASVSGSRENSEAVLNMNERFFGQVGVQGPHTIAVKIKCVASLLKSCLTACQGAF
ncbi:hypothetical protein [Pseudosulfitobacter koreensis]|uniref:Uncharacterized protein n=1 Tax=Pseudosulfitobacter koreensis TaxID=2968472 RepID=A0ABT1YZH5_9RHOB|nr:hypothetical protein [Pseudosulfitobacter koreense]MCR8826285.1 hypothetical protein [Pseudosulfitobacter koreense]